MSIHNYFFYFKKEMPWKTPTNCEVPYEIQDKGKNPPCEAGEEVESPEEVPIKKRGDKPS